MSESFDDSVFKPGDRVVVAVGSLAGMEGDVESVNHANRRLIVLIDMFGFGTRITPTELEYTQVKRLAP